MTTNTLVSTLPCIMYISSSFIANAGVSVTGFGMALIFVFCYTLFDILFTSTSSSSSSSSNNNNNAEYCLPYPELCDMKYAVFIQSLSLVGSMPLLIYKAGIQNANKQLLTTLIPITLVSTPLGQYCQSYTSSSWIRIVVGAVVTLVVIIQVQKLLNESSSAALIRRRRQTSDDDETTTTSTTTPLLLSSSQDDNMNNNGNDKAQTYYDSTLNIDNSSSSISTTDNNNNMLFWGIVLGCFSGFLGGLIGMRGPPLMIFFLHFTFPKHEARAVGAIMLCLNMILRVLVYALQDVLRKQQQLDELQQQQQYWFRWESSWHLYLGVIIAGMFGVPIGDWIHHNLDQTKFRWTLAILLLATGILNVVKGSMEVYNKDGK